MKHLSVRRTVTILIVLVALALVLVSVAWAAVKVVDPLNAWDDATNNWTNGNAQFNLAGDPQGFYEKLDFDDTPVVACDIANSWNGVDVTTKWAGVITIDHGHLYERGDDDAEGYQSTLNWQAVPCTSLTGVEVPPPGPGNISCTVLAGAPPDQFGLCEVLSKDVLVPPSGGGDKTSEIASTIRGSLDSDCDDVIDDPAIDPDNLCFSWQAVGPTVAGSQLGGGWPADQLQSRITDGGGDKAVQSTFAGPNAVTLAGFSANTTATGITGTGLIALLLAVVGLIGFFLYRQRRQA